MISITHSQDNAIDGGLPRESRDTGAEGGDTMPQMVCIIRDVQKTPENWFPNCQNRLAQPYKMLLIRPGRTWIGHRSIEVAILR